MIRCRHVHLKQRKKEKEKETGKAYSFSRAVRRIHGGGRTDGPTPQVQNPRKEMAGPVMYATSAFTRFFLI